MTLFKLRNKETCPADRLTPREREVFELMGQGFNNTAIAKKLVIELRTLEHHVNSICKKLLYDAPADRSTSRYLVTLCWA
ncbi:MAG: response regulator transcription factor, partial [Ardenticatenaceae bacterium]